MKQEHKMMISAFGYSIGHVEKEDENNIIFYQSMDDAFHRSFKVAKFYEEKNTIEVYDHEENLLENIRLPKQK